jgi:hypothetical protein
VKDNTCTTKAPSVLLLELSESPFQSGIPLYTFLLLVRVLLGVLDLERVRVGVLERDLERLLERLLEGVTAFDLDLDLDLVSETLLERETATALLFDFVLVGVEPPTAPQKLETE